MTSLKSLEADAVEELDQERINILKAEIKERIREIRHAEKVLRELKKQYSDLLSLNIEDIEDIEDV